MNKDHLKAVLNIWNPDGRAIAAEPFKRKSKKKVDWKPCRNGHGNIRLNASILANHITGKGPRKGIYPLLQGNVCHWIACDFDNHNGDKDPKKDVLKLIEKCKGNDVPLFVFESSSGTGFHCYIFFSEAISAVKARALMLNLFNLTGINTNTELFPKQDALTPKTPLGNLIALPFSGEKFKELKTTLYLDNNFKPYGETLEDNIRIFLDNHESQESLSPQNVDAILKFMDVDPVKIKPKPSTKKSAPSTTATTDYPEADFEKIIQTCGFMRHCKEDPKTLSCPEWLSMLSITTRCKDGTDLSHELSAPYPGYTKKETDAKIKHVQKAGCHTCQFIMNQVNGTYCASCEALGIVNSPIRLGWPEGHNIQHKKVIDDLNREYAAVLNGGRFCILKEVTRPPYNHMDIDLLRTSDFREWFMNEMVEVQDADGKKKMISKAALWLNSPHRRQYQGIVFDPDPQKNNPHYFNLWKGFAVQPVKGDWSKMRDHIQNIICNGDPNLFNYIMSWTARICQDPAGPRPGTVLVLKGAQGVGKGCFAVNFGKIFKPNFQHVSSNKQLSGNFNYHLKDCLFLFGDEVFCTNDRTAAGVLRAMVTEETITIEGKYLNPFQVKNHINLVLASNHAWIVPSGLDERRFCTIDVSPEKAGDQAYFKEIYEQMNSGGREAWLFDLLQWDISKIDLRTIPKTQGTWHQIISSATRVQKFWIQRLSDGNILEHDEEWKEQCGLKELHDEFTSFCEKHHWREEIPPSNQFSRELKDLCPGLKRNRTNIQGKTQRLTVFYFPKLDKCRKDFEKIIKMPVDWDLKLSIEEVDFE